MITTEIVEGNTVSDIVNSPNNQDQVFLLVDHDKKRILTYNGPKSGFKLQIYGGILAKKLRIQLRGFYRIFPLNHSDSDIMQETLEKQIGGGRAKEITEADFTEQHELEERTQNLSVHQGLQINKALENINNLPRPEGFRRECILVGNNIFVDEKKAKALITEKKEEINIKKMGKLNAGFTFFADNAYSTRLIVKNKKVQGIELYVPQQESSQEVLKLKMPVLFNDKISSSHDVSLLEEAFHIPEEYPEDRDKTIKEQHESAPSP